MEKRTESSKHTSFKISKQDTPKPSPKLENRKKSKKKLVSNMPIWKNSYPLQSEANRLSTTLPKPKILSILPIIVKDRPFSEDNVTHQIAGIHDIQVLGKEKLMSSISYNRELSTLRKKLNPIQTQNTIFANIVNTNFEVQKTVLEPIENSILEEKKGYVEKMRRGMIDAKKFDNPALYDITKIENMNGGNVSLEEIKDEINITINSSEKSLNKHLNECKRISEKNSQKSSSYSLEKSSSSYSKKEKKILLYNKSNQSSSNSEETKENQLKLKAQVEKYKLTEFSNESFKSEIFGHIIKWKLGDLINSGSFAQVFRAMDCNTGKIFAVKKFNINVSGVMEEEFLQEIEAELEVFKKIKHENIVTYHGHEKINGTCYIYLEYISGGNISQILSKYGPLTEDTIKLYVKQLLAGLDYLHENKIIHKDIKGANILVDTNGIVKLSDFGCSKIIEKTLTLYLKEHKNNGIQGSIPWMAPEVIRQTKYGRKSDIWSFGCTILEMVTGKQPWFGYNFDNPIAAIMKIGLSDEIPEIPEHLSVNLKGFIQECLQRDPQKRSSVNTLLNHQYLKS